MIAFRVSVNGTKICTAGVGPAGVLTITVTRVAGSPDALLRDGDVWIGGLASDRQEFLVWPSRALRVGDEIGIEVLEADTVDPPLKRTPRGESYRDTLLRQVRTALGAFAGPMLRDPRGQLATISRSARVLLSRTATAMARRALRPPGARAERAVLVELNSRRVCVAGVPRRGHVMALITWAGPTGSRVPSFFWFSVGGQDARTDERLDWGRPALAVGDQISIRFARSREHDAPTRRRDRPLAR
ncbi:hypothetical protein WME95_48730 [Sorangium sp. So ce327]|uniref:hypothetical protein n=1 Tax=Sorangium sp. So ce327 TaxID=3133301 RepID=UPI003F638EE8